jgi:RNA-directed DNA polymerase
VARCSVEVEDKRGRKKRTTINRDARQGIPQGSPISPLLSNLCAAVCAGMEASGYGTTAGSADRQLVIGCERENAQKALNAMRHKMGRLKLTVNEEKTRICCLPDGELDFLGYTLGRRYSAKPGGHI